MSARLHAVRKGSGPVLLCLHGIGSSSRSFAAQLDGLADMATVVAWDAPGYGQSPAWDVPRGMDGYADEVAALLDDLGCQSADVLGMSFGGVVATRLALRHPGRVRSLILGDSTPGSGVSPDGAAAMRQRPSELRDVGPDAFAATRARRLTAPDASEELVVQVAQTMSQAISLTGYAHAAVAMADTDHSDDLQRIEVPTLVLVGEHDRVTPPELSRQMAAALPNASYVEVPDAGHISNVENPVVFNQLVRAFLSSRAPHASPSTERTAHGR